jgi:hypothetical protein
LDEESGWGSGFGASMIAMPAVESGTQIRPLLFVSAPGYDDWGTGDSMPTDPDVGRVWLLTADGMTMCWELGGDKPYSKLGLHMALLTQRIAGEPDRHLLVCAGSDQLSGFDLGP